MFRMFGVEVSELGAQDSGLFRRSLSHNARKGLKSTLTIKNLFFPPT